MKKLAQDDFHTIVGNFGLYISCMSKFTDFCTQHSFVSFLNLYTAMGNDGFRDALFLTPGQLGAHRCMSDEFILRLPDHGSGDGGAISNVDFRTLQSLLAIWNIDHIGYVEDRHLTGGNSIANRRGDGGVVDREGFKIDSLNLNRLAMFNSPGFLDRVFIDFIPDLLGSENRTWCTLFEPPGVIGMALDDIVLKSRFRSRQRYGG